MSNKLDSKGRPKRAFAIIAKCKECNSNLRQDCGVPSCPLYAYFKYATQKPDLSWIQESGRKMTDEQREAAAERMRKYHEQRGQ